MIFFVKYQAHGDVSDDVLHPDVAELHWEYFVGEEAASVKLYHTRKQDQETWLRRTKIPIPLFPYQFSLILI